MNILKNSREVGAVFLSLLLLILTASEFGKSLKILWPVYGAPLFLFFFCVGLAFILSKILKNSEFKSVLIYAVISGSIGFAILMWVAHLPWQYAVCVPLGGATAILVAALFCNEDLSSASLLQLGFLAGSLVVALRLGGILGASFYGITLVSSFFAFTAPENLKSLWAKLIFSAALLVIGRAAIQYYLLQSGYASLGVVVSLPYSFLLLFLGIAIPLALQRMSEEKDLSWTLWLAFSLLLPLTLGFIFHTRALAAFLLGLVSSSFIVFVLWRTSFRLGYLVYLNLIVACAALPYFVQYSYLGRLPRVGLLTGSALLFALAFALQCFGNNPKLKGEKCLG